MSFASFYIHIRGQSCHFLFDVRPISCALYPITLDFDLFVMHASAALCHSVIRFESRDAFLTKLALRIWTRTVLINTIHFSYFPTMPYGKHISFSTRPTEPSINTVSSLFRTSGFDGNGSRLVYRTPC